MIRKFADYSGIEKKTLLAVFKLVVAGLSLSTAHYVGFMCAIPFEMVSIIAIDFMASFIGIFLFYLTLCYTAARFFSFIASQVYASTSIAIIALMLRLKKEWPELLSKPWRRMHGETRIAEQIFYYFILFVGSVLLFNFSYLRFDYIEAGRSLVIISGVVVVALILKTDILARWHREVVARLADKKRVRYRARVLRDSIHILAGTALLLSFYSGFLRFDKLQGEDEVYLEFGDFSGKVNLIIKSGSSLLAIDNRSEPKSYIYLNEDIFIRLDKQPKDKGG